MTDAYEVNSELTAAKLPDDAQEAFDKVHPGTVEGDMYVPIALLGTQVVSGTNYAVLCLIQSDGEADAYYAVVTVYVDLDGNAEYTVISPIDIDQYVNYTYNDAAESSDEQN